MQFKTELPACRLTIPDRHNRDSYYTSLFTKKNVPAKPEHFFWYILRRLRTWMKLMNSIFQVIPIQMCINFGC